MNIQSAGVSGILLREGDVLLIHRAPHETEQAWEFPKGKVEFGENPKEAIVREYEEETGLSVTPVKILDIFSWQYSKDGNQYHVVETVYQVELADGHKHEELKLSDDHDDFRWATLAEIDKLEPMVLARKEFLHRFLLDSN